MLRIGLTGGIGSGKSTVARMFEVLGVPVYDADLAARELMNRDKDLKEGIIRNFGEESYKQGKLDRKYLAAIVFNDKEKLQLLNQLTHPVTIKHAKEWMEKQNAPYVIKEAALLFESGANKGLDEVIGVFAPLKLRVKRVMNRDHLTEEEVMKRVKQQMDDDEKMRRCDHVLVNDESALLTPQVFELHEKLLSRGK